MKVLGSRSVCHKFGDYVLQAANSLALITTTPRQKPAIFISSETQSAEQLLTLACRITRTINGAPDQLVSQVTWDVLENGVPRGVDCASLGVGKGFCPRTVNVAVYNTGYLVMLTDYTGKRAEDDVYTAAGSSDLYPFVRVMFVIYKPCAALRW